MNEQGRDIDLSCKSISRPSAAGPEETSAVWAPTAMARQSAMTTASIDLEGLGRYGRGQEREDVGDGEADQEELVVYLL